MADEAKPDAEDKINEDELADDKIDGEEIDDDLEIDEDSEGAADDSDDDDDDEAPSAAASSSDDDDEEDDEVEADLDAILRERMAKDDDDDEDEEDEVVVVTKSKGKKPKKVAKDTGEPAGRQDDEHVCTSCYMLVRGTQLGPLGARSCPSGELEADCPAIAYFDGN